MRFPILLCTLVFLIGVIAIKAVPRAAKTEPPPEDYDKYKTVAFRDEPHPQNLFNLVDLFKLPTPPPKKQPVPKKVARKVKRSAIKRRG